MLFTPDFDFFKTVLQYGGMASCRVGYKLFPYGSVSCMSVRPFHDCNAVTWGAINCNSVTSTRGSSQCADHHIVLEHREGLMELLHGV